MAVVRLHELLLRIARSEVRRRSGHLRTGGPELDDVVHQAPADPLVAITAEIGQFRGESRFTTWAYKFVMFEVSTKIGRHVWRHPTVAMDTGGWDRLPDRFGLDPARASEWRDLVTALNRAVDEVLTYRQRQNFVALVLNGVPLDALVAELGTNRNAIYKMLFDARRKLRAALFANGSPRRRHRSQLAHRSGTNRSTCMPMADRGRSRQEPLSGAEGGRAALTPASAAVSGFTMPLRTKRLLNMEPAALLEAADHDAHRLLAVASTDWQRPVSHCPAWDAAELVRHTGGILSWVSAVVESNQRVSRRSLDPAPENPVDLAGWYLVALGRTLDVLGSAHPDSETWTFSSTGDNRVRWWCRRLAVEVAIHHFDIEHAAADEDGPPPTPVDGGVAAAGIEEFVIEFLPGLLTQVGIDTLIGTLHLHATDGPTEWWIDLNQDGLARREHATADTALRGIRSDLLLWLTNRKPSEALGERAVLERWGQLRR